MLFRSCTVAMYMCILLLTCSHTVIMFDLLDTTIFFPQESLTPLHKASHYGHPETVRLLLEHGAEVDMKAEVSVYILPQYYIILYNHINIHYACMYEDGSIGGRQSAEDKSVRHDARIELSSLQACVYVTY